MADEPGIVAAIVLAAGRSTRMAPRNKLLLRDAGGVAMAARVAAAASASRVAKVIVVTGHQSEAVEAAVREGVGAAKLSFVRADDFASGLSASLRAGLSALCGDEAAVVVCLGDMPLVGPAEIDRMIAAFDPVSGRSVIVPMRDGRRGNPVLWGSAFLPALRKLSGDRGARALLEGLGTEVHEVAAASDAVLVDFDTQEALQCWSGESSGGQSWGGGQCRGGPS